MVCLCVHFFGGRIYSFQIFLQGWATHQKIKSSCLSLNPRSPEGAFHASQFQLLNQLQKCWLDFAISKRSLQIAISAYLSISMRTMMHFVQCALAYLQSTSEIRKVSDLYRCCFSWGGPRAGVLLELRSSRICFIQDLSEMQNPRPHLWHQDLHFTRSPGDPCTQECLRSMTSSTLEGQGGEKSWGIKKRKLGCADLPVRASTFIHRIFCEPERGAVCGCDLGVESSLVWGILLICTNILVQGEFVPPPHAPTSSKTFPALGLRKEDTFPNAFHALKCHFIPSQIPTRNPYANVIASERTMPVTLLPFLINCDSASVVLEFSSALFLTMLHVISKHIMNLNSPQA